MLLAAATTGTTALSPDANPSGAAAVIVETHGPPGVVADAARALGARVTWTYAIIDAFAATVPVESLPALAVLPGVARVHEDRPVGVRMDVSARAIEADKAWAIGRSGAGVTVAVIDSGIDRLHPAFSGAIVACVALVRGVAAPGCDDSHGHGTHVAGSVASRLANPPGVAPGAKLAIVRVLHAGGLGFTSDVIAGMDWVRAAKDTVTPPIRVATMSVGPLNPGCGSDSTPEAAAANRLVDAGVAFTVAAGNAGHEACTVDGAGAARLALTVGAVDDRGTVTQDDDVIADFSSAGPTSDGLVKPEVVAPGVNIRSAWLGGAQAVMSGTSMATPHVAGVAALILSSEPTLSPADVKARILAGTVRNAYSGADQSDVYGFGLANACRALSLAGCAS